MVAFNSIELIAVYGGTLAIPVHGYQLICMDFQFMLIRFAGGVAFDFGVHFTFNCFSRKCASMRPVV